MNGYERIMNTLHGKPVDQQPIMLHNFMPAASELGMSMGEFRKNTKNIADAFVTAAEKYDLDGILIDIDTCMEAYAMGVPVDFPNDEPARAIGAAGKNVEEILEKLDPQKLHCDDRIKMIQEACCEMKHRVGSQRLVRCNADQAPFSLAMLCYGMEDFMADLLDEEAEEGILHLIDRCYNVHLEYHKLLHSSGADLTSFGDSSSGPDLISKSCYEKFAMPYHKRLARELRENGIETVCHICGKLDNILPLVADLGFIAVEVDYKTNIQLAHDLFKGKTTMFGPIDPSGVFYYGTPEMVARETQRVLDIFGGQGLVIGAGCALPSGTPAENIQAFVKTVRAWHK